MCSAGIIGKLMSSNCQLTDVKIHIVQKTYSRLCSCCRECRLHVGFLALLRIPIKVDSTFFFIEELYRTNHSNRRVLTLLRLLKGIQWQWYKCSLLSTFGKEYQKKKSRQNRYIPEVVIPYSLQHVFNKLEAGTFSRYLVISIVKFEISSLQQLVIFKNAKLLKNPV